MAKLAQLVRRPSAHRPGRYVFLTLLLLALLAPAGMVFAGESSERYVVLFNPDAVSTTVVQRPALSGSLTALPAVTTSRTADRVIDAKRVASQVRYLQASGGVRSVGEVYSSAVGGFAGELTDRQARRLAADPAVSMVLRDEPVSLDPALAGEIAGGVRTTANPRDQVQPGVRRVGARNGRVTGLIGNGRRINADVAILDTGVQRDHPDLNVVGGYNCTGRKRDAWGDGNGHGTHVAGVVGALDNSFGVTGVAPGARLWSVKVLDARGRGFLSWVVCGVDWVTAQRERSGRPRIEVVNMSLSFSLPGANDAGCGQFSGDPLHRAICDSVKKGTVYVVAAGNESRNARRNRPAAYDEVITVSAMADYDGQGGGRGRPSDSCPYWSDEPDDGFASFSNFGADVDLIAPGKCVLSTFTRKRYAWMSGTSMATPHVAGAAAIYRAMYPRANPQQVRLALQAVGKLDWRTGTDPDRVHEKAVWIGEFRAVPDFSLSASTQNAVAAPGSQLVLDISLLRVGGLDEPIRISLANPPRGLSANPVTVRGRAARLTVDVAAGARTGRQQLTIVAAAADVEHLTTLTVVVGGTAAPRTVSFTSPAKALTVQPATNVTVAWNEGTGKQITERRLERFAGRIATPGTCAGVRFTSEGMRSVSGAVSQTLSGGRCYRWRLILVDAEGGRTTVDSNPVLVDTTAPRAPSVTLTAESARVVDLERIGVDQAYVGLGGALWVRDGVNGSVLVNVESFDPESAIAANVASVDDGRGWRTEWVGNAAAGALRLYYGAGGSDARLLVRAVNGAGLESAATVGILRRDGADPRAVVWTSAPEGSTRRINATSFRMEWGGGSDEGSGLAGQHIVGRYRAGLTPNGECRTNGFSADGPLRLLGNRTTESGLQPGSCYVWSVRTLDNVGNYAASVVSGYVIVEPRR